MKQVVIVAAKRTAIGKFGGSLAKVSAPELGATVIQALLAETGVAGEAIDEVILGQVLAAGAGQNPARQAVIKAGLPDSVSAMTINKVCGSGLKAVMLAAQAIACGDADIIIAGGQENMSASAHVLPNSRDGFRMGNAALVDTMINDGLWDAFKTTTWVLRRKTWRKNTPSAVRRKTPLHWRLSKKPLRRKMQVHSKMKSSLF